MNKSMRLPKITLLFTILVIYFDLVVLSSVYVLGSVKQIPLGELTRDAGNITGQIFIGILSNLGIILWSVSATVCFLGAILLNKQPFKQRFLFFSGLLTSVLAIDDAFLLHDGIIPRLFHIHEWPCYVGYILIFALYITFFISDILSKTDYPILGLAFIFFGVSIVFDVFFETFPSAEVEPFIEDGLKFIGISLWCYYFFIAAAKYVKPHINTSSQSPA